MVSRSLPLAAAAFALAMAGCVGDLPHADVVATFYPLEEFSREVAGPGLAVRSLVRPGAEPHDFEPTPRDIETIATARAIVVLGAGFESWVRTAQDQAPGTRLVVATEGLPLAVREDGTTDPHAWLDPVLAQGMAQTIGQGLAQAFPEEASAIANRTAALVGRLQALDAEFRAGLAQCEVRAIVANHSAFAYVAARYNFTEVAVTIDPQGQPDPAAVRRVIDAVRHLGVQVVYFEDLVSPAVADTIARETGARTLLLSPLESLPAEVAQAGGGYAEAMRLNLRNLREGMRCA